MSSKPVVKVVCAVIHQERMVLACQRGPHRPLANLWEFPGGKIESEETEEIALIREIKEELHCDLNVESYLMTVKHEYDDFIMLLSAYLCTIGDQKPMISVHRECRWVDVMELNLLDFAQGDIPVVSYLETLLNK